MAKVELNPNHLLAIHVFLSDPARKTKNNSDRRQRRALRRALWIDKDHVTVRPVAEDRAIIELGRHNAEGNWQALSINGKPGRLFEVPEEQAQYLLDLTTDVEIQDRDAEMFLEIEEVMQDVARGRYQTPEGVPLVGGDGDYDKPVEIESGDDDSGA